MNVKRVGKRVFNKSGGYITEAAIIAPLFILAVIALISIIPVISMVENTVFAGADEMRQEAVLYNISPVAKGCPVMFKVRAERENKNLKHLMITGYYRGASHGDIEDLIILDLRARGGVYDPLEKFTDIPFSGRIVGRAYTGRYRKETGASDFGDGDRKVWIFPEDGVRFHNENCRHVKACCKNVRLTAALKSKLRPCPNCDAKAASIGSPVYVFPSAGEAYHLGHCRSVKKYCTETTKARASAEGYTPCLTCGG